MHNVDAIVCAEYSEFVSVESIKSAMQNAIEYLYPHNQVLNISILITTNKNITQLNTSFRGIKESTDVLSFSPKEMHMTAEEDNIFTEIEEDQLGDIVISYEEVESQSKAYHQSREEVLNFLLIHGLLHLSGYDHATVKERTEMQMQESTLLQHLNISNNIVSEMYEAHRLKG